MNDITLNKMSWKRKKNKIALIIKLRFIRLDY